MTVLAPRLGLACGALLLGLGVCFGGLCGSFALVGAFFWGLDTQLCGLGKFVL